jgi:hypothetical protein
LRCLLSFRCSLSPSNNDDDEEEEEEEEEEDEDEDEDEEVSSGSLIAVHERRSIISEIPDVERLVFPPPNIDERGGVVAGATPFFFSTSIALVWRVLIFTS